MVYYHPAVKDRELQFFMFMGRIESANEKSLNVTFEDCGGNLCVQRAIV